MIKRTLVLAAALTGSLVTAGPASADTVLPGVLSRTELDSDGPCLQAAFAWGIIRNLCTRPITVFIPLITDTSDSKTVQVKAWGPAEANDVICNLQTQDTSASGTVGDLGQRTLTNPGRSTTDTLIWTNKGYSNQRTLYLKCQLNFDGRIYSISYNP